MTAQREMAAPVSGTTSSVVRTLLANRDMSVPAGAIALGMSRASIYRRLNEGGWDVDEVDVAAKFFGVPVDWFFYGIPGLEPGGCARRDSNPQPSDPQMAASTLRIVPDLPGQKAPVRLGVTVNRPLLAVVASR